MGLSGSLTVLKRQKQQEVAMSAWRYSSSNPDQWTLPRAVSDANQRYRKHGPLQPMPEAPGLFRRMFRLH